MEEETQAAINDVAMAYLDALAKGEEDKDLVLSVETQEVRWTCLMEKYCCCT
jgi:hypothetical protein